MQQTTITEPRRTVPVAGRHDVVVCGGGPSGAMAALTAAKAGANVLLLEAQGCLGGIWTAGLLAWFIDMSRARGVFSELLDRLIAEGSGRVVHGDRFICDPERVKLHLEAMCLQYGVNVQLHTRVTAAVKGENGLLTHVITESKSGRQAFGGKVFIDATGDGDLGALAGCGFDMGSPQTGKVQPLSLIALLTGIDAAVVPNRTSEPFTGEDKKNLLAQMQKAGMTPSYTDPFLAHIDDNIFLFMTNHMYGVAATDARAISDATLAARAEIHRLAEALRSLGHPWSRLRVLATGGHIGVREGRRIHGKYTVTAADLAQGARHADSVCRVTFGVDIHSTDKANSTGYEDGGVRALPYDIPARALMARDVDNLLMAGRCISGDFVAHSSYRVTGPAALLGIGAGELAAAYGK